MNTTTAHSCVYKGRDPMGDCYIYMYQLIVIAAAGPRFAWPILWLGGSCEKP